MLDYEKLAEGVMMPDGLGNFETTSGGGKSQEGVKDPGPPPGEGREFYPLDHPKYQGIAEAKGYSQHHARIEKTRYSHDAMIDVLITEPEITQVELAKRFQKTQPWISRIIGSDAFQGALAKRRDEILDPFLVATIEERFRGLAMQSLDVIAAKLETTQNTDLALKALDISAKSLGFGARNVNSGNSQTNYVIQLPQKIADAAEWADAHNGQVIEHK